MHENWHPKCFTLEDWHKWLARARQAVRLKAAIGYDYCADCTIQYQDLMKHKNLCSHPERQPRFSLPLESRAS